MNNINARLGEIVERLNKIALPLDVDCVQGAIRHLNKNVDHESFCSNESEHNGIDDTRYAGNDIATVLNSYPYLLRLLKSALGVVEAVQQRRAMEPKHSHPDHECPECDALTAFHQEAAK